VRSNVHILQFRSKIVLSLKTRNISSFLFYNYTTKVIFKAPSLKSICVHSFPSHHRSQSERPLYLKISASHLYIYARIIGFIADIGFTVSKHSDFITTSPRLLSFPFLSKHLFNYQTWGVLFITYYYSSTRISSLT